MFDGRSTDQTKNPQFEYTAQAASPYVNGEAKLTIDVSSLTISALFDAITITFAEINSLSLVDYAVIVKADSGDYTFSRMGSWCQPFYDELCAAFNKAVLRSLFIKSDPIVTAKGGYSFAERGVNISGSANVHVYDNNVTSLPADLSARRVPLCFTTGMDKGDYALTLTLDTGESYTYSKLGYDTAPFADAIEGRIRKLREESRDALLEIDPGLVPAQVSQLVRIMPTGAAAPIGQLAAIAPSFAEALETRLNATRAFESYAVFKELSDPRRIWVGFRKNENFKDADDPQSGSGFPGSGGFPGGGNMPEALTGMLGGNLPDAFSGMLGGNMPEAFSGMLDSNSGNGTGSDSETGDSEAGENDPYLMWLIAPSPDGQFAAVEFAEANTATFVYRTGGDFTGFARQINRALEAISFKREVIRLSDEELKKPENADYYMASKRTAALQFVRSNFVCRVIHSSPESWKRNLTESWTTR